MARGRQPPRASLRKHRSQNGRAIDCGIPKGKEIRDTGRSAAGLHPLFTKRGHTGGNYSLSGEGGW